MRSRGEFGMKAKEILKIYRVYQKEGPGLGQFFREGEPLMVAPSGEMEVSRGIFDLLNSPVIRRGNGILYDSVVRDYLGRLEFFVQQGKPVELVFLGFPFKCHNPTETVRRLPDLGELAFLIRLLDIDATVKQIYPPGVNFTVLAEGNVYKDLFGASDEEVERYQERLKEFIAGLNAKETISLVDLKDVYDRFPEFGLSCQEEGERLRKNRFQESCRQEIKRLVPVMMRSLPVVEKVALKDLFAVYDYQHPSSLLTEFQRQLRSRLLYDSEELAIRYLAIQRAKKKLRVIPEVFFSKLYVSTIARPEVYSFHPIHRRTRLFPHHGVPILGSDKVEIIFFKEVVQNPGEYTAVFCPDDPGEAPFYFLKGRQHQKDAKIGRR